jgi:excisionase family DNA binding protein
MREQTATAAQLITREEAKRILRVSGRTVDRLVERNLLPAVRMPPGRAVRFRPASIEEFVTRWEAQAAVVENGVNATLSLDNSDT